MMNAFRQDKYHLPGMTFGEAAAARAAGRAKNAAANVEKRAARAAAAMTCQCCGSDILANTGVIAHHGYQRPGDGWQTQSCFGARRLPFEVDRAALGELIEALKNTLYMARATLKRVREEAQPIVREFTDYSAARVSGFAKRPTYNLTFTRATFEQMQKDHSIELARVCFPRTFVDLKKAEVASHEQRVKMIAYDVKSCEARYDGWKKTHRSVALSDRRLVEWVKL